MESSTSFISPESGKYLVYIDESEESHAALNFACHRVRKRGGSVTLLSIIEPVEFQSLFAVTSKMRDERRMATEKMMQQMASQAMNLSGTLPDILIREGDRDEEIINATLEDSDITMLVVGASPTSSGNRRLVTSLATQLGDRLLIPVILVPGNLTEQQLDQLS
jgi:nucleotide-binding universal stress UspA family protein